MATGEPSLFSDRIVSCLQTPDGSQGVERVAHGFRALATSTLYPDVDGLIPSLYQPEEGEGAHITQRVKSFYEETPFPNYEGMENFGDLVNKGGKNPFIINLLRSIGYNKVILECGCGTGQLSHYLQLNNNHVLGVDMSLGSLKLAVRFKLANLLLRSNFCQMNLFHLAVKDNAFDVVLSNGVLHHTYNARKAFAGLVRKAKPGGIVIVGLYNRPARFPTWVRSKLIRTLGPNIDYVLRKRTRATAKIDDWLKDQYFNPHETWHSIDEVMGWFAENGVTYLHCSPPILGTNGEETTDLFAQTSPGTFYQRQITQLAWLFTIARVGALFLLIGRKQKSSS